jgi:hypothetical protein
VKNEVLKDIMDYARRKLVESYTYCGVADGDDFAMLNCDDRKGNDITIEIKIGKDI